MKRIREAMKSEERITIENWVSLLTAKEMSGQVKERYCRLRTVARYGVGSKKGVPEVKEMDAKIVGKGVRTGFALAVLVRLSRS